MTTKPSTGISAVPSNWREEYERLSQSMPRDRYITGPISERSISLSTAMLFVRLIYDTEEIFSAAYRFGEWMEDWWKQPESEYTELTKAPGFPLGLWNTCLSFKNWFALTHGIETEGGVHLNYIESRAIGWYMKKGARPSDEEIRAKLLAFDFVREDDA